MNLCDYGHEEVCFEGRICPVCEKMDEIKELKNQLDALEQEIENIGGK